MSDRILSTEGPVDDFEDLFEHAPCGYLTADKDGRIGRANRTFADWTGYSPAELAGKRFPDLLSIGGKVFFETHFAPLLRMQGSFSEVALEMLRADRSKMPVLVNAIERRDAAGENSFIRFTIFNATDRRRYEHGLLEARDIAQAEVRSERALSELREQFIAVLGHDLRNPLASITSGVRLLGREPLSDRGKHILELMEGSVIRATGLIDNVMDFARTRLGQGLGLQRDADEPLEPVLRQVVSELRSIDPSRTVTESYAIDRPIDCDRGRIGQLLSNLLGNALTHGDRSRPVAVEAAATETLLEISVANAGTPISAAAMEKLFQPFFRGDIRANREGLGLGLHIASEIAAAHGGTLDVRSDDIETRFIFTMPLA